MKAASVLAVFFDINKRLITRRKVAADTYAAGEPLENAGLIVAPITGRPAGWVDQIARLRQVEGVAGETGGFFSITQNTSTVR